VNRIGRAIVVGALAAAVAAVWLVKSGSRAESTPVDVPSAPEIRAEQGPQPEPELIAASRFVELADDGVEARETEAPILVAGRVVDEGDAPIAGAEIVVYYPRRPNSGSAEFPGVTSRNTRPRTDEAGRFEIRAKHEIPEIVVEACHPELRREPEKRIAAGTRDVTLVLRGRLRTGEVTATLAKKWWPIADRLQIRAGLADSGSHFLQGAWGSFSGDGSTHLSAPPGTIEVWVVSAVEPFVPLVRIDEVVVPHEGVSKDPRLRDIDLPSSAGVLDLLIVDTAGDPVPHGTIQVLSSRGNASTHMVLGNGRAGCILGMSPIAMEITSTDFRTEVIDAVPGERTVKLHPAATVAYKLPVAPRLPEGVTLGMMVRLVKSEIRLLDEAHARQSYVLFPFEGAGEQRKQMNVPGDYECRWILGPVPLNVHDSTIVDGAAPIQIRVTDTDQVQEIVLDCPIDLIERAAAILQEGQK
jgi:hypothetical protein